MSEPLATVDRLATRLGVTLTPNTPDYARAEECLWSASVRARALAGQEWTDPTTVPDEVVDVVLAAAYRLFRNPDRHQSNQAGSFAAAVSPSDLKSGVFLDAERRVLMSFRGGSLIVGTTTREDEHNPTGPYDAANYVPDPINEGRGDPFYGFMPNGPGW